VLEDEQASRVPPPVDVASPGAPGASFDDWYRSEHSRLVAALLLITGDLALASESVDEAFARAVERWGRVRAMASPTGWTFRVAHNLSRRAQWRSGLERRLLARAPRPPDVPAPAGEIWALVSDLPPRQREVVVMRHVAGLGEAEIAEALGISRSTVSSTCYAEGPGSVDPGSVEVTRDGGKTWQPAPANGETPISNVACSSTRECGFLAAPLSGKPVLVETADAGKTWASRPGPPGLSGDSIGSIALSCPSASTCTVVASSFQQTGTSGAFVTEDGGQTADPTVGGAGNRAGRTSLGSVRVPRAA
jgi:RNA polymerase sigma-70 factor (ECF subfamily)